MDPWNPLQFVYFYVIASEKERPFWGGPSQTQEKMSLVFIFRNKLDFLTLFIHHIYIALISCMQNMYKDTLH